MPLCYHGSMAGFFSSAKEKFLIIDIVPRMTSALFLDFNERRELIVGKIIENLDLKRFLSLQAKSIFQKSWEGKNFFDSRRKLVVLADATLATTIPVPLDLKREAARAKRPVTLGEVENWFARMTAKIFMACRHEASRRLKTADLDTILVNQRMSRIAIDSRVVADPIGRSGRKVSFVVELTFANRELSETLAPFFNSPGEFFFAEAPQARLSALARIKSLPVNMITTRDGERSSLFIFEAAEQGCPVVYREYFLWESGALAKSLATDLGIDPTSAEEVYNMYVRGEVSDAAKKHFEVVLAAATEQFLRALDQANLRGSVYVDAPRTLPFRVPRRRRYVIIEDVPVQSLLKKFGFSASDETQISPQVMLRYLAPFLELYFDHNRSELNKFLRRKLHWLA